MRNGTTGDLGERDDVRGYFAPLHFLGVCAAIGIGFIGPTVETGSGSGSSGRRPVRDNVGNKI
jgi:hypothetical protein